MNEINSAESTVYELLRQRMDQWPTRAPKSAEILKILKELFTREEAELLTYFKGPYIDLANPEEIASRSGKPFEEVVEILNSLADRGLMYRMGHSRKRAKFTIWPVVIGIFEFFFSNSKIWSDEKKQKLGKLFESYMTRVLFPIISASNYPWPRVIPSNTSEKMIKIDKEIEGVSQKVLAFEEIEEILNQKTSFSVMDCSCRTHHEILGKGCGKTIETCVSFDLNAEFFIGNGMAKRLTREEMLDLLRKCEKEGLVHLSLNAQNINFICNCCKDCCGILRPLTEFHRPGMFATSNFRATIDRSKDCKECFQCFEKCPTHAILSIPNQGDGNPDFEIDEKLCIGCGLCSSNCPTKHFKLVKVKSDIPELGMPETYKRYARERYRY